MFNWPEIQKSLTNLDIIWNLGFGAWNFRIAPKEKDNWLWSYAQSIRISCLNDLPPAILPVATMKHMQDFQ